MKAKPSEWLRLIFSLMGYAFAILALVMIMNLTGDCAPEAKDCGETSRQLSFAVLALGAAWLVYLVVQFLRDHKS